MKQSNKKLMKILAGVMVLVLGVCGSLAYFTDYAETTKSGTAGTVEIEVIDNTNLLDADGKNILNPGDARDVSFTINNLGNKSTDVRMLLTVSYPSNSMYSSEEPMIFELYRKDDVEYIDGKGWFPKEGVYPLGHSWSGEYFRQVLSYNDTIYIDYYFPEFILNGNEAFADMERELEADVAVDGKNFDVSAGGSSVTMDFVMLFNSAAGNEYQGVTVSVNATVDVKQHRNTESLWEEWLPPAM